MALSATPYGLRPVKTVGNRAQPGGDSFYPIASGYAANIFYGDPVKLVSGKIQKVVGTDIGAAEAYIGVFVGCAYTNPTTKQFLQTQYWPTGTVAADAVAYVVDDPNAIFQIQSNAASFDVVANVGNQCSIVQTAGSTITGLSAISLNVSTAAVTASLSYKILGIVNDPYNINNSASSYPDIYVKVNAGFHAFDRATGVNS